ncbi:putative secreted protein [Listeria monocytogenes]|nr:putative secreted protein [Listeria monocytogenes]
MVYQKVNPKPFTEVEAEAKTDGFDSEEELSNASNVIVIGELNKRGDSQVDRDAEGGILAVYRMSDFKIAQVIKNDTEETLAKNTVIPVYENEGHDEETNTTYHIAGYEKMEYNETYMLFLSFDAEFPYYVPLGVNFGKVNIDSNKETELYGQDNIEIEKEINEVQSEALEAYDDEIKEVENQ